MIATNQSADPPRGAPRRRRRRRAELHGEAAPAAAPTGAASLPSLPSAGAREGVECVGPAPADEGAPGLLHVRRRLEVDPFLGSS
jgi:hypothetical protein